MKAEDLKADMVVYLPVTVMTDCEPGDVRKWVRLPSEPLSIWPKSSPVKIEMCVDIDTLLPAPEPDVAEEGMG